MSDYKSCWNCLNYAVSCCGVMVEDVCENDKRQVWHPIPCPKCGGILSEVRKHNDREYRHCFACHFEFTVSEENGKKS